jgi:hypothetical protein
MGQWILSTMPGGYGLASGTSQAAPHVAGLAALMFTTAPVWNNATLVQAMFNTATDLGPRGRDDEYGFGLIHADRAVDAAGSPPPPPTTTPRPPSPTPPPPTPTAVPPTPPGCLFRDVCPPDLFYPHVANLVQIGAISGYGTEFRPFADLTRGQACKLAVLALGLDLTNPQQPTFPDVGPGNPFYIYIETAVARNMVTGYSCGGPGEPCPGPYFRPFAPVARDQFAKIVVVAKDWWLVAPPDPTFADVPPGSPFYPFVETFTAHNIVSGYTCGGPGEPCDSQNRPYYRPWSSTSRAQAARILDTVRLNTNSPLPPTPRK